MGFDAQKAVVADDKKRKRIVYIDSIKGFAMLCVVLGHIADGYLRSNYYSADKTVLYAIYNVIYSFHMPLFIMVSGYLYQTAYIDNKLPKVKKIFNQVKNLLAIYIEFSLLLGIFKIFCGRYVNTEVTGKQLLLIGIKTIAPYWYLYILIAFYLIFSIKKVAGCPDNVILGVSLIACIFSGMISSTCWFEAKRILYYSVFWSVGYLYAEQKRKILFRRKTSVVMGIISLVVMFAFWNYDKFICQIPIVNFIVAFGLCVMIWSAFENSVHRKIYDNKLFLGIGKYCLEIYLLHCFFTAGNRVLFNKVGIQNLYISMILNLILSIGASLLIAKLCKKVGVYELIFKPFNSISRRKS